MRHYQQYRHSDPIRVLDRSGGPAAAANLADGGQTEAALDLYRASQDAYTDNPEIYLRPATMLSRRARVDDAAALLRRGNRAFPTTSSSAPNSAGCFCRSASSLLRWRSGSMCGSISADTRWAILAVRRTLIGPPFRLTKRALVRRWMARRRFDHLGKTHLRISGDIFRRDWTTVELLG